MLQSLAEHRAVLEQFIELAAAADAAGAGLAPSAGGAWMGAAAAPGLSNLLLENELAAALSRWLPTPSTSHASAAPPPGLPGVQASPVASSRRQRTAAALAAAVPAVGLGGLAFAGSSPALPLLELQGGGGGSGGNASDDATHLASCTVPDCRRCAYVRRLQAQAQATGVQQQQQYQQQQQQQQPGVAAPGLAAAGLAAAGAPLPLTSAGQAGDSGTMLIDSLPAFLRTGSL